ncbi:MAG: NAD(P)H-quinone oxidoreductase [Myxococcota bacterium]
MVKAKAVRIRESGDADVLDLGELEVRDPGADEVLVEVAAAGLNRADILQRRGFYPAPPGVPPDVPGLEYAGTVAAVGPAVRSFAPGDRVMGIAGGGAMATHLVAHERELIPVPDGIQLSHAAAIPEVFLTAYDALFLQGGLGIGQVVLVHAAASGVGTAAIQLADVAGATVVGTSRTADKLERVRELGLAHGVVAEDGQFAEAVREATGGRAPEVVLDLVGAAYLPENVKAVAPQGRIVVVGLLGGAKATLVMPVLLAKRVRLQGTVLRSRPLEEKAALSQAFTRDVLPLLACGRVRPVVDTVMPMEQVRDAHRRMESNVTVGKIVLTWAG